MHEQPQNIRDEKLFRFASAKRYLKIFVPDFAFKHDDNNVGKDKFVGREIQLRKLYTWLTSDSKSGSYLITGYRGMGKSLLVKRVIDMITREPKNYKEVLFQVAMGLTLLACFVGAEIEDPYKWLAIALLGVAILIVAVLELSKMWNYVLYERHIRKLPLHYIFSKDMIAKVWLKMLDRRGRKYSTIAVTVNLGQEVLHERDVLSLIAQNVREKYSRFVHNRQNRPVTSFVFIGGICIVSFLLTRYVFFDAFKVLGSLLHAHLLGLTDNANWFSATIVGLLEWLKDLLVVDPDSRDFVNYLAIFSFYLFIYYLIIRILKAIRKHAYFISVPFDALRRLDVLCDRIAATVNVEEGSHPQYSSSFFNFSFGKEGRSKTLAKATVRELEQELLGIMNEINGDDCPRDYRAQFIIVFDELDKITKAAQKREKVNSVDENETNPEFDTSVKGFTDAMAYEERKQNVLRLLANMKLFIASVKAKCVFISGHELFDASLADLSDREFAISSIFNGVLNVSSFLSPEREQSDVSSMTEVYLATMLLPETYLKRKIEENVLDNGVLKDELPSLRWYNEYLMEQHILNHPVTKSREEIKERVEEIRHVMEFLRCFAVYLSHVSNGSPKKIATYFEKYVKVNYDATRQFEWYDEIMVGKPTEKDVRKQCVLFFSPEDQKLINFIHYIASPVMNAITNEVSHYGDKLLVSSSFMLDQIYKYHGKGFSWRNLEQMPELLNTNKNPELRDSMSAIVEFLLQTHITLISSGVFQYKFHKQISEEISALSKTSEEAAAIFNFTLNESETVKRYNTRLLWHYVNLAKTLDDKTRYNTVLERIHENLGDIYFSEEDYYRAIHEYRSALQCMTAVAITPANLLPYLKCSLKVGMSYEYRRTFENAYMAYCQIINQLVHLQWFEEKELGLDYTLRLTHDWRTKQPVLVDKCATKWLFGFSPNAEYRRQFQSGLYEDIKDNSSFHPKYSLDSDKTISSLSANYTPEKSDIFLKLTAFEDVKYIYQAIIAKLFAVEKMEVSGITQSSIDAAEAEFITLYSATNYKEKFMLAVDFFSKLASILYYKNNFVTADPIDNMSSALYVFDINVMAMLDDYCFKVFGNRNNDDAIKIKDDVRAYFDRLKFDDVKKDAEKFEDLLVVKTIEEIRKGLPENHNHTKENVEGYLKYLDSIQIGDSKPEKNVVDKLWDRMKDCAERREKLHKVGHKLPCNACKYANRSLLILMDRMFETNPYDASVKDSKAITLLRNTSHRHVRYLRREHLSALAGSAEQLADIMLSCACTNVIKEGEDKVDIADKICGDTIELLEFLTKSTVKEEERETEIKKYVQKVNGDGSLGKLDRTLLYYWSASRYYEIASMYQESAHCIERIAKVVEDYLMVVTTNSTTLIVDDWKELLDNLFTHASRTVGRQYDNFDMAEIHEYKWLFHLEHTDDIDLSKLTQFPNLQSLVLSIVRSKVLLNKIADNTECAEYISKVYFRVAPSLRHECTFKSEVELNYTKAWLNRIIFVDLMGGDFMQIYRESLNDEKVYYHGKFFERLHECLKSDDKKYYETNLFHIDGSVQSRLDLLDNLVFDSLVCLYNVIEILPPHNQITTFTNSFVADVYNDLWEWSKYYEMFYNLYFYYRCYNEGNEIGMGKIVGMLERMAEMKEGDKKRFGDVIKGCAMTMQSGGMANCDDFGYRYSKLFMNLRHEMDDATIHHIYTNYSAEMAIKYYRAARGINSEGAEYKSLIYSMYILDDDLRNDTCQSNLADERYMLNSGVINTKRKQLQRMYEDSNINKIKHYETMREETDLRSPYIKLPERYADSAFVNTEY